MASAHVHGLCVVQNEADIIGATVSWAARFSDRLWIRDMGSSDGTWELLKSLESDRIRVSQTTDLPYSKAVRPGFLSEFRSEVPEGTWLYVLDADEFVAADPRPLLAEAARQGAELVRGWHCNFVPTPSDIARLEEMGVEAWERLPLFERLRFYRVEWMERRFVRLTDDFTWQERRGRSKMRFGGDRKPRAFRGAPLIRHYRYRGPTQVERRFWTRSATRAGGFGGFRYEGTVRFEDHVEPETACRLWPEGDAVPDIHLSEVLRYRYGWLRRKAQKFIQRVRS